MAEPNSAVLNSKPGPRGLPLEPSPVAMKSGDLVYTNMRKDLDGLMDTLADMRVSMSPEGSAYLARIEKLRGRIATLEQTIRTIEPLLINCGGYLESMFRVETVITEDVETVIKKFNEYMDRRAAYLIEKGAPNEPTDK